MTEQLRLITREESWLSEVNQSVVEMIEDLLERAYAGEITGFAYAATCKDNTVCTAISKSAHQMLIVAGLERAKHRLLTGME